MGHLQNVLDKVKGIIVDSKESKKIDIDAEKTKSKNVDPVIIDDEVEDWYHDVGARGAFNEKR